MAVLIESSRDERTLAWLIYQCGEEAVHCACLQLAGRRRAYVSNVAKALDVTCPTELSFTPTPDALLRIREILSLLGDRG